MIKKIICVCLFCLLLGGCAGLEPTPQLASQEEQVRSALEKNPEILLNVLRKNKDALLDIVMAAEDTRRKQVRKERILKSLQNPLHPVLEPGRPVWGNAQAPVTIVEYSDFLCPACAKGSESLKKLMEKYPGKIRVYLRHFPSDNLAKKIALYFEAIGRLNPKLAWKFQDMVFARADEVRKEKLAAVLRIIAALGLDQKLVAREMAQPDLDRLIKDDIKEAEKFGISSTPSFVVKGVLISGAPPVFVFEEVITLWEQKKARGQKTAKSL